MTYLSPPTINDATIPKVITAPPNLKILAPIPVTKPSVLASKALEVIALENPVIGIKRPSTSKVS